MKEKARFLRLPALLLFVYFLGKLVMSLLGFPYEQGIRFFSMVTLEVHLALLWGAFGRRYYGYGMFGAIQLGVMVALAAQILIVIGTAISFPLGGTHFNDVTALQVPEPVRFSEAMGIRATGLVANCILGGVAAAIGWALGALIPEPETVSPVDNRPEF